MNSLKKMVLGKVEHWLLKRLVQRGCVATFIHGPDGVMYGLMFPWRPEKGYRLSREEFNKHFLALHSSAEYTIDTNYGFSTYVL